MQSPEKKKILTKEWESKLAAVKIRKEDMNRLVMNFLVTEVRSVHLSSVPWSSSTNGSQPSLPCDVRDIDGFCNRDMWKQHKHLRKSLALNQG